MTRVDRSSTSVLAPEGSRAGLRRNAVYLLQPDGYIAPVNPERRAADVSSYLDPRKLSAPG